MPQSLLDFAAHGLLQLPWWGYVVFTLAVTHVTIACVTIFLHRAQAHRALDIHPVVSHSFRFWLWLTTGMVTKEWVAIHRKHHAKVENIATNHLWIVEIENLASEVGTIRRQQIVAAMIRPRVQKLNQTVVLFLSSGQSQTIDFPIERLAHHLIPIPCGQAPVGTIGGDGLQIMAAVFVAQATNVQLTLGQQISILAALLLTSKGAAAVTGGCFITLAATLSTTGHIPVAGLALLLGIDRFMSEARAITNLIGNGVATMVIAKWEGALDTQQARAVLARDAAAMAEQPERAPDSAPISALQASP